MQALARTSAKSNDELSKVDDCSCAPLLKWPGGKRLLLQRITSKVPSRYNRYLEPFAGGAALFFRLNPTVATLTDCNNELIETYVQVRDHPNLVIEALKKLRNSEKDYYRIRAQIPLAAVPRAARFIYLCTLSFNGIYRCNLKGEFNVPYGFRTYLSTFDEERIRECGARLRRATLRVADFEQTICQARRGDLIYCDPPYTVAHNNNGFLKYNAAIFSWRDQERLAVLASEAKRKGCSVLISNADHPSVRALYPGFNVETISRHSIMASKGKFRRQITECLFWWRA